MMKVIFLFILIFNFVGLCYTQSKDLEFVINCKEKSFVVERGYISFDSTDYVTFTDWSFLDSLRIKLKDFYDVSLGGDTLKTKIGGVSVTINPLGEIMGFWILIPREYSYLYSLETIESLVDLLENFRFNLPDYKKPVRRVYSGTERYKKLDEFCYFNILYGIKQDGVIFTTWDGLYERQLNEMLLGDWQDGQERNFVFYRSSFQIYVKMLNPLTGIVDDFRCVFRAGRLYMYFDQETPSIMSYKFTDDRLTLSGAVGDQKVIWELKREHPIP